MRTAVVVGAGVAGLAAAGALARSGWQVTLVERGDRLRGCGSAQVIWPNGVAALTALGITLADVAIELPDSGIRRPDGSLLAVAQQQAGGAVIVHGDDLNDALMAGLGDRVEVHTGTDISSVRAGSARAPSVATAKHRFEADLVVAADGGGSVIRSQLAPSVKLTSAGHTAWRAVIPWFRVPSLPDAAAPAAEFVGGGYQFRYATLGERGSLGGRTRGGVYWSASAPGAYRPESAATQLSLVRRWFTGWPSPVGELLAATELEDLAQQPAQELSPLPGRFDFPAGTGGIVLLGDAAHVSTPYVPQGGCLAFEDAATLAAVVRDSIPGRTLALALAEYSQARRARVVGVARASKRVGRLLSAQTRLSVKARDLVLRRVSPQLIGHQVASTFDWVPPR